MEHVVKAEPQEFACAATCCTNKTNETDILLNKNFSSFISSRKYFIELMA